MQICRMDIRQNSKEFAPEVEKEWASYHAAGVIMGISHSGARRSLDRDLKRQVGMVAQPPISKRIRRVERLSASGREYHLAVRNLA